MQGCADLRLHLEWPEPESEAGLRLAWRVPPAEVLPACRRTLSASCSGRSSPCICGQSCAGRRWRPHDSSGELYLVGKGGGGWFQLRIALAQRAQNQKHTSGSAQMVREALSGRGNSTGQLLAQPCWPAAHCESTQKPEADRHWCRGGTETGVTALAACSAGSAVSSYEAQFSQSFTCS